MAFLDEREGCVHSMIWRQTSQWSAAIILMAMAPLSLTCARSSTPTVSARCDQAAVNPLAVIELPGNPFQAIPSADGCHVLVSLVGPVEPGDPRRPPQPGAPKGGVALVSRVGGEPSLASVVTLEGSPYGIVLTHDGAILIVTSDDRVAFIDQSRLVAGSADAILGYLNDAPMAGRMYANVTLDDQWLFLSDESAQAISVVDLRRARASGFERSAVVGQIPVGRAPIALTFSPDQRYLYTTSQVAPSTLGWPPVCTPPPSEMARQGPSLAQGAILIVDVARATRDPINAVIGAVPAGCNPVRLVTSPSGDIAYVSARTDNMVLAFDTTFDGGTRLAVTNSNRFGCAVPHHHRYQEDPGRQGAIQGLVPAGVFPRELRVANNQQTLLLTNFGSKTLALIDLARLPIERHGR